MANDLKVNIRGDGSQLSRELTKTASEVARLERQTKQTNRQMQNFNKSANNMKGGLNNLFRGIKSLDFSSISSGISSIGSNASSVLPNLGKIASTLVNPYMLAGTAILGAGTALYKYNVQLEETLKKTEQFTGLAGDELMSLRNGIKSVADTFGKDFNDVLSSVDGLMSQFKISGEEALSIIKDGFVGGCDDGGKLFDLISKYGGAFNDAGISASELVAIIGNTRSGIFSEQGMELIAKGATKIREFSTSLQESLNAVGINADEMYKKLQSGEVSTVEAMQSISSKLKELNPQSQEVGDVLKYVFGKQGAQAGFELVTALADVETNLSKVKTQTGEQGKATEELYNANRNLENAMSDLFGISDGGFSTMTTQLKTGVYNAITWCINATIDFWNSIIDLNTGCHIFEGEIYKMWDICVAFCSGACTAFSNLGTIVEGIFTLDWDKVKTNWNKGLQDINSAIDKAISDRDKMTQMNVQLSEDLKIKKHTSPDSEIDYNDNKKQTFTPISTTSTSTDKKTPAKKTPPKEEKAPTFESGSLKDYENRLKNLNDELNNTNVKEDRLTTILSEKKAIEEQIKQLKLRNGLLTETPKTEVTLTAGSLADIQKQLSDAQSEIKMQVVGSDKYNELAKKIAELTGEEHNIKLQIDNDTIDEATKKTNELKAAQERAQEVAALNKEGYQSLSSVFSSLGSAIGGAGGQFLELASQSISAIGEVIPQIVALIGAKQSEALASGTASAAALPFPANIAAIASIVATITALFSSFAGSFADGGFIGGQTTLGDLNIARVNKGEMILNNRQGRRLFNLLDGNGFYNTSSDAGGNVTFKIHGKELIGVLSNYNKKINKVL